MMRPLPLVAIAMGSKSDWDVMQHAAITLKSLGVPHICRTPSAHRTAERMRRFALKMHKRVEYVIAGAGGSAALPGMIASFAPGLKVLGVPIPSGEWNGQSALLSMIDMPEGVPLAVFPLGKSGAVNAALFAGDHLAKEHPRIQEALAMYRAAILKKVGDMNRFVSQFDFLPDVEENGGR